MNLFNNEWKRMQHPYAKKIPQNIWRHFEFSHISAEALAIMEKNEAEILGCLQTVEFDRYNKKQEFFLALVCGHPNLSIELFTETARILKAYPEYKIIVAASLGRNDIVRTLISNHYGHISFETLHSAAFIAAAANGHMDIVQEILRHTTKEDRCHAFSSAAIGGHINVLQYLEENISKKELQEQLDRMKSKSPTSEYDCKEFKDAASNGHLHILKYLEGKISSKELQQMISSYSYEAFQLAALNGHVNILKYLEEKVSPEELRMIIRQGSPWRLGPYEICINAAINGHIDVWEHVKSLIPKHEIESLEERMYEAAARNGNIDFLEHLAKTLSPNNLQKIQQDAFVAAAHNGQIDVLKYLAGRNTKDALQKMLNAAIRGDYFTRLCESDGTVDILKYLATIDPEKTKNKIIAFLQSNDINQSLCTIARMPYSANTLRYLDTQAHAEFMAALLRDDNAKDMVINTAQFGDVATMTFLEEKIPNIQDIIAEDPYRIFYNTISNEGMMKHFLFYLNIFEYVELTLRYGDLNDSVLHSYADDLLAALHTEITRFGNEHPDETFDITNAEQARKYFCVLHNLIRRRDIHDDSIALLLNIPAVKALALSTTNNDSQRNEILHLAQSYNPDAVNTLIQIPEFNDLIMHYEAVDAQNLAESLARLRAVAPWLIRDETTPQDLQTIAQDSESSMRALTKDEQDRLQLVIDKYMPQVQEKGVEHIINDLRNDLRSRYALNPASITITTNGKMHTITLPFMKEDFDKLQLSPEHHKQALEEYCKHPDHTAFRYLSKPNPWINPEANHVYVNPTNTRERWAMFEGYQELMAILYTAACDKNTPPIEKYTLETRIEGFIKQLALTGRAHNWDATRVKLDKNGNPVLDAFGKAETEEYDDLEKDKPSCFSGIKKRLFDSLQGHPLFIIITEETINEEIRDFARQHFSTKITAANKNILNTILNKVAAGEELDPTEENVIKSLDIENPVVTFNSLMQTKYGPRIMAADLQAHIQKSLVLKDGEHHLLRLLWVEPQQFFQPPAQATSAATGFFATSAEQSSTQTDNKNDHPSSCNSKKS